MRLFSVILAISVSVFVSSANAHNCLGKVQSVDVAGTGNVQVNIAGMGDGNTLCSLNRTHGEFTAEACKASYSLLLAAQMSAKNVRIYFRNDTNTSCAKGSWIDYATIGVYYIRVEN